MPENSIEGIFEAIKKLKVLIIGDAMIDRYSYGKVDRISPEAPVPIINVDLEDQRLGGAANVALNIQSMGATPILCTVIGDDQNGSSLLEILNTAGLATAGVVQSASRITTIKHRIISGSQHLMRIDSEDDHPLDSQERKLLVKHIQTIITSVDVVIFEDYDKGVLDVEVIQEVITSARKSQTPTVVDPKERNFFNYNGCTLFKPNLPELSTGFGKSIVPEKVFLDQSIERMAKIGAEKYLVTLSKKGIYWKDHKDSGVFPAHERSVSDISGAGDTVVSLAALAVALDMPQPFVAEFANLGGGIVCEYQGVVPISRQKLLEEVLKSERLNLFFKD